MNHFNVTSKPVTLKIITVEMSEELALAVAEAITKHMWDPGWGLYGELALQLERLKDSIKGHVT